MVRFILGAEVFIHIFIIYTNCKTLEKTYWDVCDILRTSTIKPLSAASGPRQRRLAEGCWLAKLNLDAQRSGGELNIVKANPSDNECPFYFVKRGTQPILAPTT
jgi:hypothetical protein